MGLFDFFKRKKKATKPKPIPPKPVQQKIPTAQFYQLNIANVVRETNNAISVYLKIPTELKQIFTYKPGQYITLRLHVNGQLYLRSYSISSCPYTDQFFRIAIKEKTGGAVSPYLVKNLQRGQQLEVFPPLGSFTPSTLTTVQSYFLYAGGSGITPMISIAKSVLVQNPNSKVWLIYANRNEQSIIYKQELKRLQQKHANRLHIQHILDTPSPTLNALPGIFTTEKYAVLLKNNYLAQIGQAQHFICGPTPMMQAVENALKNNLEIPASQVHIEYFDMDKQAQQNEKVIDKKVQKTATATPVKTKAGDAQATLIIDEEVYELTVEKDQTVLAAALNEGVDAPYMCEAGVCASCRAKVTEGKVTMQACFALTDTEIAEGYVLTCQSLVQSAKVTINYDE